MYQLSELHVTLDQILHQKKKKNFKLHAEIKPKPYSSTNAYLNKILVVLANICSDVGDQHTEIGIPPPYFCNGTAASIETSQTYIVRSQNEALTNKLPYEWKPIEHGWPLQDKNLKGFPILRNQYGTTCWFQEMLVTYLCPGFDNKVAQVIEGLVTMELGSMFQMKTPSEHPTASSEALRGLQYETVRG